MEELEVTRGTWRIEHCQEIQEQKCMMSMVPSVQATLADVVGYL